MLSAPNQQCVEACLACAAACDHCAASCLRERDVALLAQCVANDIDCAEICRFTAGAVARCSKLASDIRALCAEVCETCEAECAKHTAMAHCRACAEACRRCIDACRAL